MRVVILVPWRAGDPTREAVWMEVAPYLQRLGSWPIYLGDRPGAWSRAAACNAAARDAGPWDVAIIADADTIPEERAIATAVERVARDGGALRPHTNLWMLTENETRIFMMRKVLPKRVRNKNPGGGLLVISRKAWDTVGGFDERFVGWGHEDSVLSTNLIVKTGWDRVEGNAWHLWHPRDPTDTPERKMNRMMMVKEQMKYGSELDRISSERGFDVRSVL